MVKQLILLINFFSISFVTIFLSDGIEIDTNLPNELVKDSTYIVDVVIKKGDLFGFAKYQQEFPEGFDAKPVETAEASFTYADGKMKFIWMALPETEEVKITYALTAYDGAPSEATVEGKFSYIADNERKSYDIPNQLVRVIGEEEVEESIPAIAEVGRTVEKIADNRYRIDLTIDKSGVYGFAKLEEFLPEGAEAEVIDNQKAVFSQVDEKAKFVWMSIPEDEQLSISYVVQADADVEAQLNRMEGNFAFLEDEQTKTVAVIGADVDFSDIADAGQEEQFEEPVEAPEVVVPPVEVPEESNVDEVASNEISQPEPEPVIEEPQTVDEPVVASNENKVEPATEISDVPAPDNGVLYRVQIVAGHKLVTPEFIKSTYKFDATYDVENHEGWIKYITGEYDIYKQARDKRESLVAAQHNFPGPFVTAYNAGERITVQEALMITNQKWFK